MGRQNVAVVINIEKHFFYYWDLLRQKLCLGYKAQCVPENRLARPDALPLTNEPGCN